MTQYPFHGYKQIGMLSLIKPVCSSSNAYFSVYFNPILCLKMEVLTECMSGIHKLS